LTESKTTINVNIEPRTPQENLMGKFIMAFVEAAFITIATYIVMAITLFVTSANRTIPGFMTSTSDVGEGNLATSLAFHGTGGAILLVVATLGCFALHRSVGGRRQASEGVRAG